MSGTGAAGTPLACPSAQPDMAGADVLGVMERDEDGKLRLSYVTAPVPVTPELLDRTGPVPPTEILRFSAPCVESKCQHFDGSKCQLAARVVAGLGADVSHAPPCKLRKTCRWHAQEGVEACLRCPQVTTHISVDDPHLKAVAGVD